MDRETDSIAKERQTSEALTEGLMGLLKPLLEQVDTHVEKTQATQSELGKQLDSVEAEMAKFAILQEHIPDVSASTQKLSDTKALLQKTISLVTSIENRIAKMNKTASKAAEQLEKKRLAAVAQQEGVAASLHPDMINPPVASSQGENADVIADTEPLQPGAASNELHDAIEPASNEDSKGGPADNEPADDGRKEGSQ
eukprot:TRINITY_DN974_c0_g1_i1.p1 TRINITY_DN974_c0_g1~~TRINITY_DN974_c0_g1_i1.p1  ORF type:complete len:198 (+),score=28.74 TRINITY_DN974_c0_g1_i1:111-704(+)